MVGEGSGGKVNEINEKFYLAKNLIATIYYSVPVMQNPFRFETKTRSGVSFEISQPRLLPSPCLEMPCLILFTPVGTRQTGSRVQEIKSR